MTSRERIVLAFTMRVIAFRECRSIPRATEMAAIAWARLHDHLATY